MPSEEAVQFLANIASLMPDYRSLDVRVVGQVGLDDQTYLRGLHAVFLHEEAASVSRIEGPSGPGFWSHQAILQPDAIRRILDEAETGSISIAGRDLIFQERENRAPRLVTFYQARQEGATTPATGMHVLGVGTDGKVPTKASWDQVEASLRALDPPWDGWQDVSLNFLGFRPGGITLEAHRPASLAFQVEAPLGLHLEKCEVTGTRLEVSLAAAPNIVPQDVRLALFGGFASHQERQLIPVETRWKGNPLTVSVPLKAGMMRAVITATYRGWEAGKVSVRIPGAHRDNPRVQHLRHVLGDLDIVRDGLLDEKNRGRDLEPWLALLFYELGVLVARTDNLGAKTGVVDLVATIPGKDTVLMVECTEDAPDNKDKLRKLLVRANQVTENAMQDTFPVLVTRLSSAMVPTTDRQTAGREGIALIAREDLLLLAQMAEENTAPDAILRFLESRIPPNPDSELPTAGRRRGPIAYI